MPAQKKVDYEAIEPGWRAGVKSPAQLAAEYEAETGISVTRTAIIKHFGKLGIPRDLSAKIKAKAEAMVAEASVTGKVSSIPALKQKEIVDSSATEIASIRLSHRRDIIRAKELCLSLLEELESQTIDRELYEQLGEQLRQGGRDGLNDLYRKVTSTSSRVKSLKDLSEALKVLIALEREAWGLSSEGPSEKGEDLLTKALLDITGRSRKIPLPSGLDKAEQ